MQLLQPSVHDLRRGQMESVRVSRIEQSTAGKLGPEACKGAAHGGGVLSESPASLLHVASLIRTPSRNVSMGHSHAWPARL